MRLIKLGYEELVGQPGEWQLEQFGLQQINLIVGRNAVGKTRTLNVIAGLARYILTGETPNDGKFACEFSHDGEIWSYNLHVKDAVIVGEVLTRGSKELVNRQKGEIYSAESDTYTRFKLRDNQLAVTTKLDLIQTPYLEPLNNWANAVYYFHFSSMLGKNAVIILQGGELPDVNLKDENQTSQIYIHAFENYGAAFDNAVVEDMRRIGYDISYVGVGDMTSIRAGGAKVVGMVVEENGIKRQVDQHAMSTGMYRALAILIHVNLGLFSRNAELILLDDIGEGLDFERSTALVKLLIEKINQTNMQIIMTSNDRFIMNAVDVDYWAVLSRSLSSVRAFTKSSNPTAFEDFKYSGLQNFDFFSMDLATETEH